jgi:ectoine hydroxylase-related dioxygenase (phytanoyl-CoA dioxygenase family)
MKAGSALVYLGGLTHSGGANRSDADRTGVVIGYCAGWLRTYEEQFLAYPRDVARWFPEELQSASSAIDGIGLILAAGKARTQ